MTGTAEKTRILILEDDVAVANMMKFYFEEEDYEVQWVEHGAGFIERAVRFKPHLICLDALLPDSDGFDVCSMLKKDKRTKSIPVMFVTVRDTDVEEGLALGAEAYVVKPFSEHELKSSAKRLLAVHTAGRSTSQ